MESGETVVIPNPSLFKITYSQLPITSYPRPIPNSQLLTNN